jgi:thymidylate synthase
MRQYLDMLQHVLDHGVPHDDRTGVGTLSVFGYQARFDLNAGFPLLTTKKIPLRWVFEELRWFLSGSVLEGDLAASGVDIWKEWADAETCAKFGRKPGDLGPVYGHQWRNFGATPKPDGTWENDGVDQIATLIHEIQSNPDSRRLIVSGWNPKEADRVALPPCHTLFQFKIFSRKTLCCQLYQRSADLFLGVPFNIASYSLLTLMIAHVCNLEPGEFIHTFGDLHLYTNAVAAAKEQLKREPYALPSLTLNPSKRAAGLEGLLGFRWEDLTLKNYKHHPKISVDVAV